MQLLNILVHCTYLIKSKTIIKMNRSKRFFGIMGAGAMALASMFSGLGLRSAGNMPQQTVKAQNRVAQSKKQDNTPSQAQVNPNLIVNEIGGIPLHTYTPNYGMSPKQYGMIVGSGGKKKSNRLRYSHNAKVNKRKNNAC